jgi:hypothetical protein
MTLTEFRALCEKEWRQGLGGEVAVLWLTGDSYKELLQTGAVREDGVLFKEDGATSVASRVIYDRRTEMPEQVGVSSNTITNPATRGQVRLKLARDRDVADVWIHGRMETRIL